MNEETWDRVKQLFHDALARPEMERGPFLDLACADDTSVRTEVEELLAAHERVPEESSDEPPETGTPIALAEGPGAIIGRYKLLELIGEGGFGAVYMAAQEEPVRRRVALKIIKLGMDTKQVIARFEAERQALAMMEHPNIAKVLDAGATDSGRPYFVMELVRGLPITQYCDDYELTTRERLELFIQLCHAMQHAHQKGVIHRDLKPSNVLVTRHDGEPVPKVIDFGVAKATHIRLTEKTMFTGYGQFIGTPAYMSPEQAELSGLDIDTRTDIYSLGVLLYELLTGTTPFDARSLRQVAFQAMQRILKEEAPPKPSTRLSTLGDSLPEVARRRRTEPAALTRLIRGDLDWIVMKALEKDRRRRYDSASELAADIRRHFNDEPVIAGPPTTAYRVRKLLARHRGPVAAVAAILVTVVVLGSLSTWLGWRATRSAARVHATAVLASAAATDDPLLKAQLVLELADLPEAPGRLAVAREAANFAIPIAVLRGHERTLTGAAFSADGTRLVTTGRDGAALVWRIDGTAEPVVLSGYRYGVGEPAFSPDGELVAASSQGGIYVWPTGGGDPVVLELRRPQNRPWAPSFAFSPDGTYLLAGAWDGTSQLWKIGEWDNPHLLGGHLGPVTDVAFDPGGRLLATASEDGTARLVRTDGSVDPLVLRGHQAAIRSVDFSADGLHLVTASDDGSARIWSADGMASAIILRDRDRAPVTKARFIHMYGASLVMALSDDDQARMWLVEGDEPIIVDRQHGIEDGVLSRDGRTAITMSGNTARVWRVDGGGSPILLRGHELGLHSVSLSADGSLAVTVGEDAARVWKTDDSGEAFTVGTPAQTVESAAFGPDSKWFAAGFADGTVQLGPVDGTAMPTTLRGHDEEIRSVAFSPDGTRLVTASKDRTARVWRVNGTAPAVVLEGHEGEVNSAKFSPGMEWIATGSEDGTVRLWRSDGIGEPIVLPNREVDGRRGGLGSVQFSSDGAFVAAAQPLSPDPAVLVWRVDQPGDPTVFRAGGQIEAARFSPDGRRIVIASTDGTATVWRFDAPEEPVVFHGHLDEVLSARFSPDGRLVVTSSTDATARVWQADDAREITVLRGHDRWVTDAAFSPSGTRVVTASSIDTTARVWPLDGSGLPLVLRGHRRERTERWPMLRADFSPSGTHVMTVGGGSVRIWRVTWPSLLAYLRESVAVCLTADQLVWYLGEAPSEASAANRACERELPAERIGRTR